MVTITTKSLSAAPKAAVPLTAESAVLFLEHLAADCASGGGELSAGLRENEGLRRRLLVAMEKLVPELETPPETGQRVLYGVGCPTLLLPVLGLGAATDSTGFRERLTLGGLVSSHWPCRSWILPARALVPI